MSEKEKDGINRNQQKGTFQQQVRMTEEGESLLDILCVGETSAGKSSFLRNYTGDSSDQELYRIFIKRVNKNIVYFYELEQEEELYLQKKYDGILFFVDFVSNWQVTENVLKWLQMESRNTGTNIFKIPIRVVVNRASHNLNFEKWKKTLSHQLESLFQPSQIYYFETNQQIDGLLGNYCDQILTGKASGIRCTNYTHWKVNGTWQYVRNFLMNMKLTFFRFGEAFEKWRRKKQHKQ